MTEKACFVTIIREGIFRSKKCCACTRLGVNVTRADASPVARAKEYGVGCESGNRRLKSRNRKVEREKAPKMKNIKRKKRKEREKRKRRKEKEEVEEREKRETENKL